MKRSTQLVCLLLVLTIFLGGCLSTPATATQVQVTPSPISTIPSPTATKKPYASLTPEPWPTLPTLRAPQVREPLPREGVVEFHILHWNDFHGELAEHVNAEKNWNPGAARLAAFVKAEETKYGRDRILLLDAGDWSEGAAAGRKSKGMKVLEFYKSIGMDAMTVGNHEFFYSVLRFEQFITQADPIRMVSVNLIKTNKDKSCSDQRFTNPYAIFELGEEGAPKVRVAVIGAGAPYLELQSYSEIHGVCFPNPVDEILHIYDDLMATEHPDVLIALTHEGISLDHDMAEALNAAGKPVDIIVGGHSHTFIDQAEKVGNTYIVTAGEHGREVGVLDLVYDRARSKLDVKWHPEIFSVCSPEDPDTVKFLADTVSQYESKQECNHKKAANADYLIDLPTVSESVGYWTLGKGIFPAQDTGMTPGQIIFSHEQEYPYGLFAHAPSKLQYALDGRYTTFVTEINIKETACGDGASFLVSLDGKEIYRSDVMKAGSETIPLSLDVTGGKRLQLQTLSGGDDNSCDWTIWGDPYLVMKE
jgi:hypothetical protein